MESAELSLFGLAIFLISGWIFNWCLHLLAILYAKWKLHHHHKDVVVEDLPGISILKPLVGIDPNLYENLETFFNMKYPEYELLFCIQDEYDASRMIVQSLIDKYPKVDAKIFLDPNYDVIKRLRSSHKIQQEFYLLDLHKERCQCGKNIGVNPKINNMITGYEAAKHDLIMISDSGLKMSEDTLLDMKLTLTEKVGLVHQMPYACTRKGFGSHAETVYFGTQFAKIYLCADALHVNSTTGMSCLMRKEVVEEAGGLKEFGQYLAEDYFIAQAFIDRWMKLRHAMVPTTMFFEPISQCMVLGLTTSWAVNFLFDVSPLSFFLIHVLVWFLLDYIMIKILENGPVPFSKFEFVVCWFINELSYLVLLLQSHWNPKIGWRGRTFKLKWGGYVEEIFTKQTV